MQFKSNTAVHRYFVKVPKILGYLLTYTAVSVFAIKIAESSLPIFPAIIAVIVGCSLLGMVREPIERWMTWIRVKQWCKETQGFDDKEEIIDFLVEVDPEDLESMVGTYVHGDNWERE